MKALWVCASLGFVLVNWVHGLERWNVSNGSLVSNPLLVGLTLIQSAAAQGAVCLDGSLPGYHLHPGYGSGANSWLVNLEGGGWCGDVSSCVFRKTNRRGSSNYMEKEIPFTGILSDKREENPDFYNWNRVKVRYCDGASFTGEGHNRAAGLFFRGQRIYVAAMQELMLRGMRNADQALLAGCSAGGSLPYNTAMNSEHYFQEARESSVLQMRACSSTRRTLRSFFGDIVNLQHSARSLPTSCTSRMDAISCFFPQNVLPNIQTPLFILNTAYDVWQLQQSLARKQLIRKGVGQNVGGITCFATPIRSTFCKDSGMKCLII
uniref:Pectin acetylesterase n=1 Tax=Ananas comosus var. bracteatus TaxID=296719 RepID=A0A6V7PSH0_ANACO|nr:unnamed protein product [Ananas comosus var. bracteatus]